MKKNLILCGTLIFCLAMVSSHGFSAPAVPRPFLDPSAIPAGRSTPVTIWVALSSPALISGSVNLLLLDESGVAVSILGSLRDDGLAGDARANDGVYTIRKEFSGEQVGRIRLQVSMPYKGMLKRVLSEPFEILVQKANEAPLARDQAVATDEDKAVAIMLTAADADGDSLTYAIVTPPSQGALSGNPPAVTYTPAPDYNGSDSFTFKANDGKLESNTATVSITVREKAPKPTVSLKATPPVIAVGGTSKLSWTSENAASARIDPGLGPVAANGAIEVSPAENTVYTIIVAGPGGSASASAAVTLLNGGGSGIMRTAAGTGEWGDGGDEGAALAAMLRSPRGLAIDPLGNIYFADESANRVRKIDPDGMITTVAGNEKSGYSGDGGPATEAPLSSPQGVAVDGMGNLYIVSRYYSRVSKVDPNGIITTVAGNGSYGNTGDGGPATKARLYLPSGVAVDQEGNLYIVDSGNHCVRKVDRNGIITRFAGLQTPGYRGDGGPAVIALLHNPEGLAFDASGNLYIADSGNQRIRKVDPQGIITTVAGTGVQGFSGDGGPATEAALLAPSWITVDIRGSLYIADYGNQRVRRVDPLGIISTVAGKGTEGYSGDGGPAVEAEMNNPQGVAVDTLGNLYISDYNNHRIRLVEGAFVPERGFISGLVTDSVTGLPLPDVTVMVTDYPNSYTTKTDSEGSYWTGGLTRGRYRATFSKSGYIQQIINGTLTTEEDQTFQIQLTRIPPQNRNIITTVAGSGGRGFSGDGGPALEARLSGPSRVAADGEGNFYFADTGNNRIRRVDANGMIATAAGNGWGGYGGDGGPAAQAYIAYPEGVALDGLGNLYLADTENNRVRKVGANGIITTVAGNGGRGSGGDGGLATQAQLNGPSGVTRDRFGNLYIADTWNHRVRKVDGSGVISTVAGSGDRGFAGDGGPAAQAQLYAPLGLAVDNSGNLYIADSGNGRVRKVDQNGVITTLAGNGEDGYNGDWLPAREASLSYPTNVAVDGQGNLLIADCGSSRVRKVDGNGAISTFAGNGEDGYGGDGGPALEAGLSCPYGVMEDAFGDLYIADRSENRIRKVWVAKAMLSGLVKDATSGLGLPGVTITVETPARKHGAKTDANGAYWIFGLIPGTFTATFEKSGYLKQITNGSIQVDETRNLDVRIAAVPLLSLAITSPLDGVTVNMTPLSVTGEANNGAEVTVNGIKAEITGNSFSATIPLVEGLNSVLAEAKDSYGQTASRTIQVTLTTRSTIAGTVTDGLTGLSLPSASVSITDFSNETRTALTDENGGYSFGNLPQGAFAGNITKDGYKPFFFSGSLAPGETLVKNAALTPILPVLGNVVISGLTMTSATISWTTDQASDSQVDYGTSLSYGNWEKDPTLTTTHMIKLTNLAPGITYHFKVTSTNGFGFSSSSGDQTFITQQPLLSLAITSPPDGAIITRADILVKGTVINAKGNETGVTVNGKVSMVVGNEFFVNHLPLRPGTNTLQVIAKDIQGNTVNTSVEINVTLPKETLILTANVESGISPLEVLLTIDSSLDLANASLTYTGPGEVEFLSRSVNEYRVKIAEKGLYYFTVSAEAGGIPYEDTIAVVVLEKADLDLVLSSKWELMRARLQNQDLEGALEQIDENRRSDYRKLFDVVSQVLPALVQEWSNIHLIESNNSWAVYDIQMTRDGMVYSFQLLFTKDSTGIWRIASF